MTTPTDIIKEKAVVPVLVIDDIKHAEPLGQALIDAGLPIAEVTMRTNCALDAINIMSKMKGLCVGAGTVLSADHAKKAIAAGATYLVSPGLDEGVHKVSMKHNIPSFPGAVTPSEVQKAWNWGIKTVKFFPAGNYGGTKTLKALSAVFRDMSFMPTGGVSPDNLQDYLSLPAVIACGGSWIAPQDLLNEQNFTEIKQRAQTAVELAKNL